MSLQVWLPLNGDLENQGLSAVEVTNTGATVAAAGKIGQCYQFGPTAKQYLTISKEAMTSFTTEASVCFWFKVVAWNTSYATFFQAGLGSTAWTNYIFGFLRNNAASTCCFTISNGSSASNASYLTPAFDLDKWYHVALVYKTGHCLIYIDGELYRDYTTSIVPNFAGITTITTGICNNKSSYQTNCQMNDLRLYDHALSAKEVEEIAQGLVLHYKLDQNLNQLNNVYNYPTFNTSSANGGWSHWGPSGHSGTYSQNTDKKYIYNKSNTYSHIVDNTASATGKYYLVYQSPAFAGGYRSVQFIVKEVNSLPITEAICCPGWNARNGGAPANKWTRVIDLGDGFYLCQVDGLSQDGSNDLVSLSVQPGYKIYVSEGYLEDDKEFCSNIFFQNSLDKVYDSSGYGHHAVPVGTITVTDSSPRYGASIKLNGSSAIKCNSNTWMAQQTEEITINLWVKPTASFTKLFSCTETGGWNTEGGTSGYLRFPLYVYTNEARTSRAYIYDSKEILISSVPLNEWTMVSFVYDSTGTKTYINGELHHTYTRTSYGIYYNLNARLFLGCEANTSNPTSPYFTGQMSDFRIYATALTPAAIQELYHTSATIDKSGNVYAREVVEI